MTEYFEPSPYVINGGDIEYKKHHVLKYIILVVVIMILIYWLYCGFYSYKINGEDYYQRVTHHYFNNLHGEVCDDDAKNVIEYGERIENPTAIDHYRIGTTYLLNINNPEMAHDHFNRALNQVINGDVDIRVAPFIIERIDDYKDRFMNFPDMDELPIQQAIIAHYENQTKLNQSLPKQKTDINPDDPEYIQKTLLSRQNWQSDSQNVHDTALDEQMIEQFKQVRDENVRIPNIQTKTYNDMINWLRHRYKDNPEKLNKLNQVTDFLEHKYNAGNLPNANEQDVLVAIWQRAHDPGNKDRIGEMKEAIADAVLDCVEGDHVVCMAGRTKKYWQALAKLDKDPSMGVLRSKQMLRNEIYERSAKIVNDFIGEKGSVSDTLRADYIKGEKSEQVSELIESIKKEIDGIKKDYEHQLPSDQLQLIIEECKAVV